VGLQPPKLVIFGIYKFSPMGYIPLSNFYTIWLGEEVPGCTHMPNFTVVALKITAPEIAKKMVILV